jgi:adenine phosphoribosyltransferase
MSDLAPLAAAIRDIPDFPQPGIIFKDITPLLGDARLFRRSIELFCGLVAGQRVDKVVGIDARGFIFGGAVADRLGAGFVPVRKKGKLPWLTHGSAYTLEYGEAIVEVHQDAVARGERVLLVDDLLATGGTAAAALKLLAAMGAEVVAAAFLIELEFLGGRKVLHDQRVESLLRY